MKMSRTIAAAACVFLMMTATGAAQTLTIVHSFDTGPITPGMPTIDTFNVPQFDPALGELQRVTFTYNLDSWGGYFQVENITEPSGPVSGNMSHGISASLSGTHLPAGFTPLFAGATRDFNLPAAGDTDRLDGPTYDLRNQAGPGTVDASPINFGLYTGTGTFAIDFSSSQASTHTASGGVRGQFESAHSQGFLTVTYQYIPEPTFVGFAALGASIFLVRRRLLRNRGP